MAGHLPANGGGWFKTSLFGAKGFTTDVAEDACL